MQPDLCITPCGIVVDGEKEGFEINIQAEVSMFFPLKYKYKSVGLASSTVTHLLHSLEQWEA